MAKEAQSKRLMDRVREVMRLKHYSIRTERTYCDWIKRYVSYHKMRTLDDLQDGEKTLESFLTHLAVDQDVAASTQNQAMNAVVFLYRDVLKKPLGEGINAVRAKKAPRLPVVLTPEETWKVIDAMSGITQLVTKVLYGSGLRIIEAVRLRVGDIDFALKQITVRSGKGDKDRWTILPDDITPDIERHLSRVKELHKRDLSEGYGEVYLPHRLADKYPNAPREWRWQYLFPADKRSVDPRSGKIRRHHVRPEAVQNAVRRAARKVGMTKRVTCHTFRHSFATHLLLQGTDIRTIQELLGHNDVNTTMIYTHVIRNWGQGVKSPLDVRHTAPPSAQA